jgi:hypothetical protein
LAPKTRAAQAKPARISRLTARRRMRTLQEAVLAAAAARRIFISAHASTTTARLKVSTRPGSGMVAQRVIEAARHSLAEFDSIECLRCS